MGEDDFDMFRFISVASALYHLESGDFYAHAIVSALELGEKKYKEMSKKFLEKKVENHER